uniref:Uncharacterized protein n=1 Tax=Anguilla anguilla TaxID=7936 RepID=A0A0E9QQZ6_ANGAN
MLFWQAVACSFIEMCQKGKRSA